jgi:hypothetical protein
VWKNISVWEHVKYNWFFKKRHILKSF